MKKLLLNIITLYQDHQMEMIYFHPLISYLIYIIKTQYFKV